MKRKSGFTLVELLVVMAIISILAAIAIPNVVKWIQKGRVTKAQTDIKGLEAALTDLLADAGRSSLEQLFKPYSDNPLEPALREFMLAGGGAANWPPVTSRDFERATLLYTRALTGLLRSGRNVLGESDSMGFNYSNILQEDIVRKLGTNYIDVPPDPWGNLYNIYPGPWTARTQIVDQQTNETVTVRMPIPFRIFYQTDDEKDMPGSSSMQRDQLVVQVADIDKPTDKFEVGFPAPPNEIAFIWSNGANLVSSQLLYNGTGYPTPDVNVLYDVAQGEDHAGGGDDINNWDNGLSWTRFSG